MNFYEGYQFFSILALVLIPALVLGILEKPLKHYNLCISLVLLGIMFGQTPLSLLYLLLFFISQYLILQGYLVLRKQYGRKEKLYYAAVFLSLLPLVLNKVLPLFHYNIFQFLGISYLTFKCIQMIIESYDGAITSTTLVSYGRFILFFPTISCGPIDRSRRFKADTNRIYTRKEYLDLFGDGLMKLLLGLVYKLVIASLIFKVLGMLPNDLHGFYYIIYAYCYGFYLFFDFAGYSLMAIGTSYLLGIRTPDNFRKPFLALDMTDFWDRWHITLSHWFRDFIFSRFVIKCVKKKYWNTRLQRACAGFLVNMGIMGVWHGLTPSYLLYGCYHGILLALTEVYKKKTKFYKKHKNKTWYKLLSWFVTLQFVMLGFLIFSGKLFC